MSDPIKDKSKDNENIDSETNKSADTNVSSDEAATQSKQDHIKERLKDLGVSEESDRPEKSWYGRYGNYVIATVIVVLSGIYWLEYKAQDTNSDQLAAKTNNTADSIQNSNPHVPYAHQKNMMPANNAQYAQMHQQRMQQNRLKQNEMRKKAWEQQKLRYQQWQKQVREQQEKNRQAWEQYNKQQQAMYERMQSSNGVAPNNGQQRNNNPYYAAPYRYNNQGNNFQNPGNMQPPQGYQGPPPAYRQPYPNQMYNQRW